MEHSRNKLVRYLTDNHIVNMRTFMEEGYTINEIAIEVMRMQSAIIRKHTHKEITDLKVVK